jgi:octaprenyl-diphosphate synthase
MSSPDTAVNKTSVPLAQLFEPIRDELAQVEEEFSRQVQSHVRLIPEIGRYILQSGGKRVRPAVLLMAARLSGYTGTRGVLYGSVVEFIHAATLVHDDIVDNSDWRRGQRAVHSRWGADVTVLLGDYLYIKSMDLALQHDEMDILRLLSHITLRMIEGELYQLSKNGDLAISEAEHFEIIRRKTAGLFGGCAQIGAMLGGVSPEQQEALREYGHNLGVTFQLVDDLLDLTGDEKLLGKPVGSDLREGKMTLPVIYLLRRTNGAAAELVGRVARERPLNSECWRDLSRMLVEFRAIDYAHVRAAEYADRAKAHLDAFPPGPERDALKALPDYVLSRDR